MIHVTRFIGQYHFLSNFYPAEVMMDGELYPSIEHAYQAAKTANPELRKRIRGARTPGAAKRLGRSLEFGSDWDSCKILIMRGLLQQKFSPGSKLANRLLQIDGKIEEGNWWNDEFWGVNLKTGLGENHLGKLLMKIRDDLKGSASK